MSWITPKTNWQNGDFYNMEDVDRISSNLNYLKNLSSQVYPADQILFLTKVSKIGDKTLCNWLNLELSKIDIYGVNDYLNGESNYTFTYYDSKNLYALYKLKMLLEIILFTTPVGVEPTAPYVQASDKIILYDTDEEYYTGCGYYQAGDFPNFYNNNEDGTYVIARTNWWSSPFWIANYSSSNIIRRPFNMGAVSGLGNRERAGVSFDNVLANRQFWSYTELNLIESDILNVYNTWNEVLS